MEIIYRERTANILGTIKAIPVGDFVIFPHGMVEESILRTMCSKLKDAVYSVNKSINGFMVTRQS